MNQVNEEKSVDLEKILEIPLDPEEKLENIEPQNKEVENINSKNSIDNNDKILTTETEIDFDMEKKNKENLEISERIRINSIEILINILTSSPSKL